MSDTKQPSQKSRDIFVDRRQTRQETNKNITPCRRQNNFNKVETSSWWLKVNYVKQHLNAVGDGLK